MSKCFLCLSSTKRRICFTCSCSACPSCWKKYCEKKCEKCPVCKGDNVLKQPQTRQETSKSPINIKDVEYYQSVISLQVDKKSYIIFTIHTYLNKIASTFHKEEKIKIMWEMFTFIYSASTLTEELNFFKTHDNFKNVFLNKLEEFKDVDGMKKWKKLFLTII